MSLYRGSVNLCVNVYLPWIHNFCNLGQPFSQKGFFKEFGAMDRISSAELLSTSLESCNVYCAQSELLMSEFERTMEHLEHSITNLQSKLDAFAAELDADSNASDQPSEQPLAPNTYDMSSSK